MAAYPQAGQDSPVRETQVNSQVGRLENAIEMLEGNVGALIGALSQVSRSEPPTTAKDAQKIAEMVVPLASRLRTLTERIDGMANVVIAARERLEV